ncbi:3-oxoacyl-[acyl-carrier-protein] synthase III C-terminal domain-containing protein [Actinokineospora diospyrosa]|uniref:3-oxoacyl-[acyl-carrier-protein] synthase-3 n=1 Tax=Actinokineospora diospyrosa TaxID=103728 RepID=A0ABT1I6J6_9PSEU|nr:3-oxoacyl-[acyl-carrier-protein] synthase III C-terminal domain-containing protein [Actinokineospora diospyrosa]MCP2268021.1 3-oxoacyl-[acyl-carrier-protein] synthase-3 [Actinokineospora diospyrosa]
MSAEIGIGAIHCVLPEVLVPVADLPEFGMLGAEEAAFATSCGIDTVGEFADLTHADLAARACLGLGASADVLLLVGPRSPDVLLGSDVSRVQHEAKLDGAFAFTVDGLGCTGSSAAWGLAKELLIADPGRESVVVAFGSRPTGVDRIRPPVSVIGDGGYAMSLVRGGRPVLRAHRVESDGRFHDLFAVDYKQAPWYEWREVCADPDRYKFELAMESRGRLNRMVDEVLTEVGASRADVAATIMQNVTANAFKFYSTLLGLPIHPVCERHLVDYGHIGAMDVVLNFQALLATGDVGRGDLVVVINNSPTAAWSATLWEV